MILVISMCTGAGGWKEVVCLGLRRGRRASSRIPTESTEATVCSPWELEPLVWGQRSSPTQRVTHYWKFSWMLGEITMFLVWQKFPSHSSHFSLFFHHFIQVLVLTGLLLDPPSSAEVGSGRERGVFSKLPVSLWPPVHLWVPDRDILPKRLPRVP